MNQREKNDLDNCITGHYGEDYFDGEDDCTVCGGTGQDDPAPGKYHGVCKHCNGSGIEPEATE